MLFSYAQLIKKQKNMDAVGTEIIKHCGIVSVIVMEQSHSQAFPAPGGKGLGMRLVVAYVIRPWADHVSRAFYQASNWYTKITEAWHFDGAL